MDADDIVKSMKETLTGIQCATEGCQGDTSEWDQATREGICAECFWGRGPVKSTETEF